MGGYARTKRDAEVLVAQANDKPLKDGRGNLRTIILRPSVMYGEQDPYFVSEILQVAAHNDESSLSLQQHGLIR